MYMHCTFNKIFVRMFHQHIKIDWAYNITEQITYTRLLKSSSIATKKAFKLFKKIKKEAK